MIDIYSSFAPYWLINIDNSSETFCPKMIKSQFLVGLPMAGLASLFVTLILKISAGDLAFEIAGLKFKGAAAPIVFWIICFLSITISIKMLWLN